MPPEQLEVRRALMLAQLADWHDTVDPCANGHVDHNAAAHDSVHSISPHGFGADWDMADAVDFIKNATEIGGAIEGIRLRSQHINVLGADGRVMAFECAAQELVAKEAAR